MLHFGDRKWGPKVQVPIVQNGWGSGAKFLWGLVSNALKSSMTPITQFLIPYPITTKYSTVHGLFWKDEFRMKQLDFKQT